MRMKKNPLFSVVRLSMDEVYEESLSSQHYFEQLRAIAEHYGLFDDMFKHGYFIPRIPLHVNYPYDKDQVTPVYSGNRLYARDVSEEEERTSLSLEKDEFFRLLKNLRSNGNLGMKIKNSTHWSLLISMDI